MKRETIDELFYQLVYKNYGDDAQIYIITKIQNLLRMDRDIRTSAKVLYWFEIWEEREKLVLSIMGLDYKTNDCTQEDKLTREVPTLLSTESAPP